MKKKPRKKCDATTKPENGDVKKPKQKQRKDGSPTTLAKREGILLFF